MKIVFVLSSLQMSGGVLLVLEYANRLAARGHTITLVTPGGATDPDIARRVSPAVRIAEATRGLPARRSLWALLRLVWALIGAIPACDVVIATHTPTVVPAWIFARTRSVACSWLFMDYAEMFRTRPLERWLFWRLPRHVDLIMTISEPLSASLAGRTSAPIVNISSGICRAELFFDQPRLDADRSKFRILYVGDDRPRKGLAEFLAATKAASAHIPNLQLLIAAKWPVTIQTDLPYEFHLQASDEELSQLYRRAHLFVSCSWGEGLGYPPMEAMACGTPVVVTNSQGVLDYARDGENCLLVPPKDVAALTAAMVRIASSGALADQLVRAGRATMQRYAWTPIIERMEGVLRGVTGLGD